MNRLFKNPVLAFLSSLKLSATLMVIMALAAAKATFIENDFGRDGAYALVYGTRWFEAVMGLLVLSLILLFIRRMPYKPRQWGFMLVHLSIVVILISAGITRYFGYEGIMPIREGESTDFIYSGQNHVQAQIGDQTASFPVRLYKPGAVDEWSDVSLGGRDYELGATEYWPRYGETYVEGSGGVPVLQYGVSQGGGEITTHSLALGDRTTIGNTEARFVRGELQPETAASRFGDLRLNVDGESCAFPVREPDGQVLVCGDYRFEITEFQTDFKVGAPSSSEGPLLNPMIRVAITSPAGEQGERILFAYHPDFSMGHSGGDDPFADLNMLYQVSSGVEFAVGGETGIVGRASFPLATMDMNTQSEADIAAGEVFPVREGVLYVNDEEGFSFVAARVMRSAVKGPSLSDDPNAPAAARIVIRDDQGNSAEAICSRGAGGRRVRVGDQEISLRFGPVIRELPYSLHLDDFVLDTYPGSDNPATYESYVTLTDPEMGIQGEKAHIYMNHPLNHRGSKHFQSSYDPDRRGTVLSVNHDPGKWPTYFGYMLISLGFILIMLKDLIWPRKKDRRARDGIALPLALPLALMLSGAAAGGALAQTGHEGHDHAPAAVSAFLTLSDPVREAAEHLIIQDFRGRMKPLDTLAREMVMKVAKRSKFEGRHPVDQYLNWSLNAQYWWDKPLIAVRHEGLKELLGVPAETRHVSAASLFDAQGRYRLSSRVEEAHRTPDRDRTKVQRKLISFDERFHLLYMTFQGSTLRLFPIPDDPNHTWQEIEVVTPRLSGEQAGVYRTAYSDLAEGIRGANLNKVRSGVEKITALQHQYGAEVIPDPMRVKAELFYNRAHLFSWMMIPLLGTFLLLMALYVWNLFRNKGRRIGFRNPFYSLGMLLYVGGFAGMLIAYVLRWIASGRAPLSNGHESLLFISLAVALAGLIFEFVFRQAAPAALGALLTVIIVGVSMLSTFDPAIGPLVPVLVSYWLNIHVTIITASYGFLGLAALIGALVLLLLLAKGEGKTELRDAIVTLDRINMHVVITGLGLLTVGTLLGGVWANESWGRYWGWDPKETWALITILVYAVVLHFRWIPALRSVWLNAAGSLAAVGSVVMTYFGVNYFLSGLHSYAAGDAAQVPAWVYIFTIVVVTLIAVSGVVSRSRSWGSAARRR